VDQGDVIGASLEENPTYTFSHPGIFDVSLIVTDMNGCRDSILNQVAINSTPAAAFSITENFEDVQGQLSFTNGTVNATTYLWDFGDGTTSMSDNPTVKYDRDGTYKITLTSWNGQNCMDTATMKYTLLFKGLYIPNAFAPDDIYDGVNIFRPAGVNLMEYSIEIRDRWGNLVWSSDKLDRNGSPTEYWNGKMHDVPMPQGIYIWTATARFRDGTRWDGHNIGNNTNIPQSVTGTVTLIR
jgi:hypothetical protein